MLPTRPQNSLGGFEFSPGLQLCSDLLAVIAAKSATTVVCVRGRPLGGDGRALGIRVWPSTLLGHVRRARCGLVRLMRVSGAALDRAVLRSDGPLNLGVR